MASAGPTFPGTLLDPKRLCGVTLGEEEEEEDETTEAAVLWAGLAGRLPETKAVY